MQVDVDRSPVTRTPRAMTGVQSSCETLKQLPNREVECVIPKNIKHKFGSQLVEELLTDDEVNKFMKQKEVSSKSSDLEDAQVPAPEKPSDHVNWYERIGYPLRCNIFPGSSGEWQSEAQATYTKEVHHRFKRDPEHWHGRTTDQLGHWVEMSIVHRKMKKALEQLEKQMENS
ncbi:ciliary microtubule inner protein 4 [Mustelus asterias]